MSRIAPQNRPMVVSLTLPMIALLIATSCVGRVPVASDSGGPWERGIHTEVTLRVGEHERSYLAYLPESLGDGPVALMVAMHGFGGTPRQLASSSGFSQVADANGFAVVYPAGHWRSWNDGSLPLGSTLDDVGFIRAIVDDVGTHVEVDSDRVYAAGMSNGAGMAVRLACDAADLFAGVGLVAGGSVANTLVGCEPSRPISVVSLHGVKDTIVPYDGSSGDLGRLEVPAMPIDVLASFWVQTNRCDAEPSMSELADVDPEDGTTTGLRRWTGCASGVNVAFYRVDGGGHSWPSTDRRLHQWNGQSRDFDAASVIWDELGSA